MRTLTSLTETAFAQARLRTCRSPIGLIDLIRQDAIGVLRRLPEMMKAGAKISTGFLNEVAWPADAKMSAHDDEPWASHAP